MCKLQRQHCASSCPAAETFLACSLVDAPCVDELPGNALQDGISKILQSFIRGPNAVWSSYGCCQGSPVQAHVYHKSAQQQFNPPARQICQRDCLLPCSTMFALCSACCLSERDVSQALAKTMSLTDFQAGPSSHQKTCSHGGTKQQKTTGSKVTAKRRPAGRLSRHSLGAE